MKIKDQYIHNIIIQMSYRVIVFNEDLYPKNKITKEEIIEEIIKQFNKQHIK